MLLPYFSFLMLVSIVRPGAGSFRPLSPYLGVYRFRLNSVMSVLHRVTGVFLYVGLLIFLWSFICSVLFPEFLSRLSLILWHPLALGLRFLWVISFLYHLLNGIRHLFWDVGAGFSPLGYTLATSAVLGSFFISVVIFILA